MDLKDYIRIIRRRIVEFISIFVLVLIVYFYVSHNEVQKYLATVSIRVGEQVSSSLDEPNILFLRNRTDLTNILNNKGPNSVYHEAAHHIRYKIELAESIEALEDLTANQQKNFYITHKREGLTEIETRESNFKDLIIGINKLKTHLKNRDGDVSFDSIENEIAKLCRQIIVSNNADQESNVLTLNLKIEELDISRWLVNEVAFFVSKKFNELNNENANIRMRQIDRYFDKPDRDKIERKYNEIVFLYRDYLANPDSTYRGHLERTLQSKFEFENFDIAFEVDHLRRNLKKIIDVGWRFNNARSFGEGGAPSLEEQKSQLLDLQTNIKELETKQIELDRQRLLTEMKYSEFSTEQYEQYLGSSQNMQELQTQLADAQLNLDDLQQSYTVQHPKVRKELSRIKKLRGIISELESRFRDNDRRQHSLQLRELDFQKVFNSRIIEKFKEEAKVFAKEVQRLEDMQMYLEVIENDHTRLLTQAASLTNELQGLKRIVEFQRIVHMDRPANKSFMLPKTYTRQTLWLTIVAGIFMSIGVIYAREYMDTRIKTEHDVRRHLNLPIISVIQKTDAASTLLSNMAFKEPFAENFNAAGTLIQSTAKNLGMKSFLITSTLPREGKTTIAINVSEALVRMGFRVLLIDADFRIPRVHEYLKIDNTIGLSSWLTGRLNSRNISLSSLLVKTKAPKSLHVLPAGPVAEDPVDLISSDRMKLLIERSKNYYDFVLVDSPPIYNVADSLTLATYVDSTVFVVGSELVEQDQVTWAKHLLENVNTKILGIILNYVRFSGRSYYYYYNGYKSYRARG